jgi:predicted secreted protein
MGANAGTMLGAAAVVLSGCAGMSPVSSPAAPAGQSPAAFADGVRFVCARGDTIALRFLSDDGGVEIRTAAGETSALALREGAASLVYAGAAGTLDLQSGEARWTPANGPALACRHVSEPIDPPLPAGALPVRAEDAGRELRIRVGDTLAVALSGVPTAGYQWTAAALPDCLAIVATASGPTSTSQRLPGFTGGSHWEVVSIRAASPCVADVRFAQRRPWEDPSEPDAGRFAFRIIAE